MTASQAKIIPFPEPHTCKSPWVHVKIQGVPGGSKWLWQCTVCGKWNEDKTDDYTH